MPRRDDYPPENDAYEAYDEYYEPQEYVYDDPYATAYTSARHIRTRDPLVRQALDWGISGSILAILLLTALYVFSPVDAIPDLIPFAGQADDLGAVLAGGGTVTFLTVLRYVLRSRVGRWGCLIGIVLTAIGAFTLFWLLLQLFDALL
ncbi:MAG: hypothetical protein Kow00106_23650 [Anaerolineae bacterium]